MDGLPALDLWDTVIEVLRTIKGDNQPNLTSSRKPEADQPNLTGSSKLAAFQPNGTVCNSKTKTENVKSKQKVDHGRYRKNPVCDGQAPDAVSAFSQEKVEDAPRLLKIPDPECPDVWICIPRHKWPN